MEIHEDLSLPEDILLLTYTTKVLCAWADLVLKLFFLGICTNEFMGTGQRLLIPDSEVKVSVKSRDF